MAQHIFTGSGAPSSTPSKVGQHYIDTLNAKTYISAGTTSSSDWKLSSIPTLSTVATSGSHADLSNIGVNTHAQIDSHIANTSNPHGVTKAQIGLGSADNTPDNSKPVSTAQALADAAVQAFSIQRSNHSGSQTASTISDFSSVVNAIINGLKGAVNGLCELDGSSLIPSNRLPSYVDDVLEFANLAGFPGSGATGKIYVDLATNKTYRWSGSVYVEISASPGSTDSVTEGSVNLYFTAARVLSVVLMGISFVTSSAVLATDSILVAIGKLQAQINTINAIDFAALVRSTVLTGYTVGTNAVLAASDTVLGAFGKVQAQINQIILDMSVWREFINTADLTSISITTLTNVTDMAFNVTAGKSYYIEMTMLYRTAATATGITFGFNTTNTAAGAFALQVNGTTGADGTGSLYSGHINSFADLVTTNSTQSANQDFIANMKGIFIATASGTLVPQFRSEINPSQVTLRAGSVALIREF